MIRPRRLFWLENVYSWHKVIRRVTPTRENVIWSLPLRITYSWEFHLRGDWCVLGIATSYRQDLLDHLRSRSYWGRGILSCFATEVCQCVSRVYVLKVWTRSFTCFGMGRSCHQWGCHLWGATDSCVGQRDQVLIGKTIPLVKVLWLHHGVEEATWERESEVRAKYLNHLETSDMFV